MGVLNFRFASGIGSTLLLISSLLCISHLVQAQACCSGGTPLAGVLGLEKMKKGDALLEINYDYNSQQDLVAGTKLLGQRSRRRNTHSVLLRSIIALSNRWSLLTVLSTIRQEEVTFSQFGASQTIAAQGIGDAVIFGQYTLFDHSIGQLLLGGGVKLPIGKVNATNTTTGLALHPDLQPGTGALDYLLGAQFDRPLLNESINFFTNLSYRITTTGKRYKGRQNYEFGNELRVLTGVSGNLIAAGGIVTPSLILLYRSSGIDRTNNAATPNTGGNWWHLRPGLGIALKPQWQCNLFGEFPLHRSLKGIQLTTSWRFRITITHYFFSKSHPDGEILLNN